MNLVEVHVIGFEALEALVKFENDFFPRKALAVGLVAHHAVHLGCDYDRFAARVGLEEAAHDGFTFAARINIGGIEEIDAEIERLAQKGLAVGFIQGPRMASRHRLALRRAAVAHASKTNPGDFQSSAAEIDVFHGHSYPNSKAGLLRPCYRSRNCDNFATQYLRFLPCDPRKHWIIHLCEYRETTLLASQGSKIDGRGKVYLGVFRRVRRSRRRG